MEYIYLSVPAEYRRPPPSRMVLSPHSRRCSIYHLAIFPCTSLRLQIWNKNGISAFLSFWRPRKYHDMRSTVKRSITCTGLTMTFTKDLPPDDGKTATKSSFPLPAPWESRGITCISAKPTRFLTWGHHTLLAPYLSHGPDMS